MIHNICLMNDSKWLIDVRTYCRFTIQPLIANQYSLIWKPLPIKAADPITTRLYQTWNATPLLSCNRRLTTGKQPPPPTQMYPDASLHGVPAVPAVPCSLRPPSGDNEALSACCFHTEYLFCYSCFCALIQRSPMGLYRECWVQYSWCCCNYYFHKICLYYGEKLDLSTFVFIITFC